MKHLQKLGKSLMLPIAVLPICGILMGIGYLMCPASMQGGTISGTIHTIGYILTQAGGAVINNMALLFVIGVAVGISDDKNGAVCLAGLVSWLVVTFLLSPSVMSVINTNLSEGSTEYLAFSKIQNPFIGIICGLLASTLYNRFKNIKLPDYLAFFSGRRFVVILTALVSVGLAAILAFLWPVVFVGLTAFGKGIVGLGGIGAGIYAFSNRILIPFGLHHALNNVFWFDTVGIGDLTNFWMGMVSDDVGWELGMYMSGFFPCMMFGIPGAIVAMIRHAKDKKDSKGILISTAVCAFICGVTEPFEFLFIYTAFPLYIAYAFLYGVFTVITYYTGFRAGFSFSAGIIDLVFSSSLPAAAKTWQIIPLGIGAFFIFYFLFTFMIKRFNYLTPDRKIEMINVSDRQKASGMLAALGGAGNIIDIDCCATRLRLTLKDTSLVDQVLCKSYGAFGVVIPDAASCQVIVGVTVQQLCEAIKAEMKCPSITEHHNLDLELLVSKGQRVSHGKIILRSLTEYVITDPVGLHARPAGGLVNEAKKFSSSITVCANGKKADAKSIISLMSLSVKHGDKVSVSASGTDAEEAVRSMMNYLRKNL